MVLISGSVQISSKIFLWPKRRVFLKAASLKPCAAQAPTLTRTLSSSRSDATAATMQRLRGLGAEVLRPSDLDPSLWLRWTDDSNSTISEALRATMTDTERQMLESMDAQRNIHSPSERHDYWHRIADRAEKLGVDPTFARLREINAMFNLNVAPVAVDLSRRVVTPEMRARDKALDESMNVMDVGFERYLERRQRNYEIQSEGRHVVMNPSVRWEGKNDVTEVYLDLHDKTAEQLNATCDEMRARSKPVKEELVASHDANTIKMATAKRLGVDAATLDEHFDGLSSREAIKIAAVLESVATHTHDDNSPPPPRKEVIDDTITAYKRLEEFRKTLHTTATAESLLECIHDIHASLTASTRYKIDENGNHWLVPTHKYRKQITSSERMVYTHPDDIPHEMRLWAERTLDQLRNSKQPAEVIASTMHHGLAVIHPYTDGTGRTARLVASIATLDRHDSVIVVGSTPFGRCAYDAACLTIEGYRGNRVSKLMTSCMGLVNAFVTQTTDFLTDLNASCKEPLSLDSKKLTPSKSTSRVRSHEILRPEGSSSRAQAMTPSSSVDARLQRVTGMLTSAVIGRTSESLSMGLPVFTPTEKKKTAPSEVKVDTQAARGGPPADWSGKNSIFG